MDNRSKFVHFSKTLQRRYSDEQITEMWNASGQGKTAKVSTINRWLRPGPETKNSRFEPWVIQKAMSGLMTDANFTSDVNAAKGIPVNVVATWVNRWYVNHDMDRLALSTVKRYLNGHPGSSGYENGPPDNFKKALAWALKVTEV